MVISESSRATIVFWLSILLAICQVITFVALIILFKTFLKLKRRVLDYEKSLPLVRIETPQQYKQTTTATTTALGAKPGTGAGAGVETGKGARHESASVNKIAVGETVMRVPSPQPNRRSISDNVDDCTIAVPLRTRSTSGQKLLDLIHNVDSFESFNSPRDSGTGSASTRSPHSSISYDSQKTMKESFNKREGSSTLPKTRSCGSQGNMARDESRDTPFDCPHRTSSSASCGPPMKTRYGAYSLRVPSKKPINENDFPLSRLKTVSIEMVGLDDKEFVNDTKFKRASRALKEMNEDGNEEPSAIEDVGFENEGYHGDHAPSNRSSSEISKTAPLACEESISSLNSESVQLEINNNEFENPDEEKYVNQEIVDAMRNDSIGSKKTYDGKHEPIYVNRHAQP